MALNIDSITDSIVGNLGNTEAADEAPVETTPVESTVEPSTPVVQEDPSIEVDFDGERKKLTAKEIRDGYLRQQDYTRKTTELAKVRKAAETVAQAYEQQQAERATFAEFMQDRRKVAQYMAKQFGPDAVSALLEHLQGEQSQEDLNAPATVGRVEQLTSQKLAQLQQAQSEMEQKFTHTLEQRLAQERASIESARARAEYDRTLNPFVDKLLNDHPILQAIDNVETLIRFKVVQANPQTADEAKSLFEKVVKEQVEKLQSKFVETNKQTLINKEKLKQGIEPPGGGGITPQAKSYVKGRRIDWDALESDALTSLRGR